MLRSVCLIFIVGACHHAIQAHSNEQISYASPAQQRAVLLERIKQQERELEQQRAYGHIIDSRHGQRLQEIARWTSPKLWFALVGLNIMRIGYIWYQLQAADHRS